MSSPKVMKPLRLSFRAAGGVVIRGGDFGQLAAGEPVEVVPVQVGEHDGVQPRQVGRGQGGLGEAPAPEALTEVGTLAAMQEVRVGEHREAAQPDQGGGGTH